MKVFVTGGAGYIGSIATEALLEAGHEVTVFDNLERGHKAALVPGVKFELGDLRDRDRIISALAGAKPDAVMHFAAYALVGESMEKPEAYFGNNVTGGLNLAQAMLTAGVRRIVFSSTCATYGKPPVSPITEDTPQRPTNPYGESKLMLEKALGWFGELHGFQAVFLRYFNACGASRTRGEDHAPETHLIPNALAVPLGKAGCVNIFGDNYDTPDGTCIRDYIHVLDLARAHVMALDVPGVKAFNLGVGQGYSVLDVVKAARRVTGHPIPAEIRPRRPGDPDRLVADPAKAQAELGWKAEQSGLDAIVESAWRWHKSHPNGYSD